ncbi:SGNH hydrolase-type esterase domain-containing protein [Coniella lustricola]|uniref:SGNH hydrolase-type esterase domain-containing protein n=1 Tax=Coniella lustricola TaxID=2025994 RepID=A0A2T2ZSG1_9PEZI|nr:SGNH hydrolase-type esterase domain-containing protein [Coniella lustricola]
MSKRSLRILCVGDSLTAGFSSYNTPTYHPYSSALTTVLTRAFPALTIDTHVEAQPGDVVCGPDSLFLPRIEPIFLTRGGGTPFDWTIVLAGTNDIAVAIAESQAQTIFTALRRVWAVPLSKGGRVLACTVPEADVAGELGENQARTRNALNALISGHRQENFHVFDLHAAMPYTTMRPEERRRYWSPDGVHLSSDGYNMLGVKLAASLILLIMPLGRLQDRPHQQKPPRPTHRPSFKDDDLDFEEESGSDSLLDHGYYVVRRKDLE